MQVAVHLSTGQYKGQWRTAWAPLEKCGAISKYIQQTRKTKQI